MARTEWAILRNGKIINVAETHLNREEMLEHVKKTFQSPEGLTVQPLYTLPRRTLEEYEFWASRP